MRFSASEVFLSFLLGWWTGLVVLVALWLIGGESESGLRPIENARLTIVTTLRSLW